MQKFRRRTVYAATIVLMLAMAGGFALAATFGTLGTTTQSSSAGSGSVSPLTGVTFVSSSTLSANPGVTPLGVQTAGTPAGALAGTGTTIAVCTTGTCIDSAAYIPAANEGPATVATDYAEQFTITVAAGTPNFDLTITFTGQSVTPSIVYVVTTAISGGTDLIYVYVDLGPTAPTITGYTVIGNSCGATCP